MDSCGLLQDTVALLAISSPLGALPVFLAITESASAAERRQRCCAPHSVVAVGAVILIILASAARLGGLLGARRQRILLRFMGLILAAVGAEILLAGVYTFVPRS